MCQLRLRKHGVGAGWSHKMVPVAVKEAAANVVSKAKAKIAADNPTEQGKSA